MYKTKNSHSTYAHTTHHCVPLPPSLSPSTHARPQPSARGLGNTRALVGALERDLGGSGSARRLLAIVVPDSTVGGDNVKEAEAFWQRHLGYNKLSKRQVRAVFSHVLQAVCACVCACVLCCVCVCAHCVCFIHKCSVQLAPMRGCTLRCISCRRPTRCWPPTPTMWLCLPRCGSVISRAVTAQWRPTRHLCICSAV